MKTTDSLDCHDSTIVNHLSRIRNSLPATLGSADQIHLRTTLIAAHRLRIVTPRLRIIIFFRTIRAHRKLLHAGTFPIVRQRIQNCQPRSAAGTVDKRMQIPPIFRIVHFFLTLITDGNIWRNKNLAFCLFTLDNVKSIKLRCILCRNILCIYF